MSGRTRGPVVRFRQFWGVRKRADLFASLDDAEFNSRYEILNPTPENRFLLRPGTAKADYAVWPALPDLAGIAPLNGLMEKRGGALMDADKAALEARMRSYLDLKKPMDEVRRIAPGLAGDRSAFDAKKARSAAQGEGYKPELLRRYWLRAFEQCWAYTTMKPAIWNRARPDLQHILPDAGGFLLTRPAAVADPDGWPMCWTRFLGDNDGLRGHAYFLPVCENLSGAPRANLSERATAWLTGIGLPADRDSARLLWLHALAIGYSPAWLAENAAGIRQGWPRVPLPGGADLLRASAALGAQLAALLDPDTPVDGVTAGTIRPELVAIAVPRAAGKPDYALTAGWGNRTDKGITMPGKGRLRPRSYAADEAATTAQAALLGKTTADVFLNETTCWANIPNAVWETHIGGYQVLKKWLSYREQPILGRALTGDEVRHVTETARRLAAILLLGPALDENYRQAAATHAASMP